MSLELLVGSAGIVVVGAAARWVERRLRARDLRQVRGARWILVIREDIP